MDEFAPKTYWEKRCELAEEALYRALMIISRGMPSNIAADLSEHASTWNKLLAELKVEHVRIKPAPPEQASPSPAG